MTDEARDFEALASAAFDAPGFAAEPRIEFAIIADSIQAANGKLFVLGGGWHTVFVPRFPARLHTVGLGLKIVVPWTRAGETMTLTIDLQNEDMVSVFGERKIAHQFKAVRPRGLPEGSDLAMVRAYTFNNVPLAASGGYSFAVGVDDVELSRVRFWARERPGAA